ncbi:MAG: polyprenyl synthetase family protein, partial [Anaerolineae bacterium]|nr:polyprenyl synthetase family protein [Anaerolineae bacterium]
MSLTDYYDIMLPAVESELQTCVNIANGADLEELHKMMAYHLGWEGEGAGPQARGKRVRPMLVLLTCAAAGGAWEKALPAAAAVELVHNFSLIHDDIQDDSPLRRSRPTIWTKWGVAQAINAGDSMFSLAHIALQRLDASIPPVTIIEAMRVLQNACLTLTQGQYLDLAYESRGELSLDSYWPMVSGKTAALLAACSELGALAAGVDDHTRATYRQFGEFLGLAFQVHDDLLGIWGDAVLTGKSAESDLMAGKKSLPVLYALEQKGAFAQRWNGAAVTAEDVPELAAQLEAEGARQYAQDAASRLTQQALDMLSQAKPQGAA